MKASLARRSLLFGRLVLIVDTLLNASLLEQGTEIFAFLLACFDLLFVLQDLGCSLLPEDLLDPWHDARDANDLVDEQFDVAQQLLVRRIVDDVPVGLVLRIQNRIDLEDRDQFLTQRIANDSLVQIEQRDLH